MLRPRRFTTPPRPLRVEDRSSYWRRRRRRRRAVVPGRGRGVEQATSERHPERLPRICQGQAAREQGMFRSRKARHMMYKLPARNLLKVWDAEAKAFTSTRSRGGGGPSPLLATTISTDAIEPLRRLPQVSRCRRRARRPECLPRTCRGPGGPHDPGHVPLHKARHMMPSCWRAIY